MRPIGKSERRVGRRDSMTRNAIAAGLVAVALWAGLPVLRGVMLIVSSSRVAVGPAPPDLPVREVAFRARDGAPLRGWLVRGCPAAGTIVLLSGYRAPRSDVLAYARFLQARFNVLLYDSRGTGQSGGAFSLGLHEVDDVRGALAYLRGRADLSVHHYGLLGVSLGAGVAIVAAARSPDVGAVVADSAYVDQAATTRRLDTLRLGPLSLPLAPLAPWTVDRLLGTPLASFSPLRAVGRLAPRGLLLIHSRDDANPTTPLSGARALQRAAGPTALLWVAPHGGHAGAHAAQPAEYRRRVLAFFRRYLPGSAHCR